ncbi:MAG: ribonuclease HII, partial [Algibacter sp.]
MRLFCLSLLLLCVIGCSKSKSEHANLLDFAPKNTSVFIKTNNLESFSNSISNSDFLQNISKTSTYKNLEERLEPLSHLNPAEDVLICFSKDDNDSLQYSVITKLSDNLFDTDSLPNYTEEKLIYRKKSILKSTIGSNTIYSAIIDSTFFASSSKKLVD